MTDKDIFLSHLNSILNNIQYLVQVMEDRSTNDHEKMDELYDRLTDFRLSMMNLIDGLEKPYQWIED